MIRSVRDFGRQPMRGSDERTGELFSYVNLEKRVPAKHPLRLVRGVVNEVLAALDRDFSKAYADSGRPSIAPERLLRALLLQAFYTIRSERQLMEQLDYNLLYRWFVGLGVDEPVWVRRCSRRTAIDCSRPTWRGSSWPNSWSTRSYAGYCQTSISRSTARRSRPGPR